MGRHCKCRWCDKPLTTDIAYGAVYNDKKVYTCNEAEFKLYIDKVSQEEVEYDAWCELYEFVKIEILKYDNSQTLPKYLVERLKDLRNGTIFVMGKGRVPKNKQGYCYEVIHETFKKCYRDIQFWFDNKTFQNERQKINYMMAIIDSNINDVYAKWKKEQEQTAIEENKENLLDNKNIEVADAFNKRTIPTSTKPSLIDFIDGEDF
jgi:hypothetical protein